MKKLLFFLALFTTGILAQTAPSGYTSHLGLRLYAGNTGTINPGKDSLDANYQDIDDGVKAIYDTLGTVKTDLYYQHNYDGSHKNGSITWDNLSTAAKSSIVQVSGSQTITGSKTFSAGSTMLKNIYPIDDNLYYLGAREDRFARLYATNIFTSNIYIYDSGRTDSVTIEYDGSKLTFDKDVELQGISKFLPIADGEGSIGQDGAQFGLIYADSLISDSTITLAGKQGGIRFVTPLVKVPLILSIDSATTSITASSATFLQLYSGTDVTNLNDITYSGFGISREGQIITVMNMSFVSITLKHGGSLFNIGSVDVVLGQFDSVDYILSDIGGGTYVWIMLRHSNI